MVTIPVQGPSSWIYSWKRNRLFVSLFLSLSLSLYIYIYIYICTYTYEYIYIYIQGSKAGHKNKRKTLIRMNVVVFLFFEIWVSEQVGILEMEFGIWGVFGFINYSECFYENHCISVYINIV